MGKRTEVNAGQQHQGGGGKSFTPQNRHSSGKGKKKKTGAGDRLDQQCLAERNPEEDIDDSEVVGRFVHQQGW